METNNKISFFVAKVGLIAVITVLLFTDSLDSASFLKTNLVKFLYDFKTVQNTIFSPNSGLNVLPIHALELSVILEKNPQIVEFSLSDSLQTDPYLYQRIIESNWPKKFVASSPFLFVKTSELSEFKSLKPLARGESVTLVYSD